MSPPVPQKDQQEEVEVNPQRQGFSYSVLTQFFTTSRKHLMCNAVEAAFLHSGYVNCYVEPRMGEQPPSRA